jgi:hypothetical protein
MIFNVQYSKDGLGKWVAAIKGDYGVWCSSHGSTPSLARHRVRDALRDALRDDEAANRAEFLDVFPVSQ